MKRGGCWAILGALAQYQFYILLTRTVSQCQDPQRLVCCHTCGIMITGLFVQMCLLPTSAHIPLHKCTSDVRFSLLLHFSLVSSFPWCPQMKLHLIKNGFLHLLAPHMALTSKTKRELNKLHLFTFKLKGQRLLFYIIFRFYHLAVSQLRHLVLLFQV